MYASVNVDSESVEVADPTDIEYVTVELGDDDAYRFRCVNCGAAVDEDGMDDGGAMACESTESTWQHDDDQFPDCGPDCGLDGSVYVEGLEECPDHYTREVFEAHEVEELPLSWANSASIRLNESSDEISVMISVGDPRGAFAFTVRRVTPDEGEPYLIMHTPYPGMGWSHMPLTELHTGTYRVMDYGYTPPVEPEPEPSPTLPWYRRLTGRFTAAWVAFWL